MSILTTSLIASINVGLNGHMNPPPPQKKKKITYNKIHKNDSQCWQTVEGFISQTP